MGYSLYKISDVQCALKQAKIQFHFQSDAVLKPRALLLTLNVTVGQRSQRECYGRSLRENNGT